MSNLASLHGPLSSFQTGTGHGIIDIDLDGVCSNYVQGLRLELEREYGIDPTELPEPGTYNLAHAHGWPFSSTYNYLAFHARSVSRGLYRNLPAYSGVHEGFQYFSDSHLHIRIVTHRLLTSGLHEKVVTDTAHWLEEHRLPYMSLCFVGPKDTMKAALHIEDAPETIEILLQSGEQVIIYDQPYNQGIDAPRAHDWPELIQMVKQVL